MLLSLLAHCSDTWLQLVVPPPPAETLTHVFPPPSPFPPPPPPGNCFRPNNSFFSNSSSLRWPFRVWARYNLFIRFPPPPPPPAPGPFPLFLSLYSSFYLWPSLPSFLVFFHGVFSHPRTFFFFSQYCGSLPFPSPSFEWCPFSRLCVWVLKLCEKVSRDSRLPFFFFFSSWLLFCPAQFQFFCVFSFEFSVNGL